MWHKAVWMSTRGKKICNGDSCVLVGFVRNVVGSCVLVNIYFGVILCWHTIITKYTGRHQRRTKTVLFKTIHFSMSTQFGSIWPIDGTLSRFTTSARFDLGVMKMNGCSSIIGTSPSDCLVSYLGHLLEECYPSAEMQSVYPTGLVNWATADLKHTLSKSNQNIKAGALKRKRYIYICPLSRNLFKLGEPDMQDIAGEAEMNS